MMSVEEMSQPVVQGGVNARVEQKDLQPASRRRVPGLVGPQGFSQSGHRIPPFPKSLTENTGKEKTPPMSQGHERRNQFRGSTLVFHSRPYRGRTEGACVPLAPACTSHGVPRALLSAGDRTSLTASAHATLRVHSDIRLILQYIIIPAGWCQYRPSFGFLKHFLIQS